MLYSKACNKKEDEKQNKTKQKQVTLLFMAAILCPNCKLIACVMTKMRFFFGNFRRIETI